MSMNNQAGPANLRLIDRTLGSPAEDLALDEALLEAAEARGGGETLRLWEAAHPVVVVGRASRINEEVFAEECARRGVPILRRVSGGGAIVAGPGCLMYSVVLSIDNHPQLAAVDAAHRFVLGRIAAAIDSLGSTATIDGTSDLALSGDANRSPRRKFSGNSLRMKRRWLLYHGTLLYDFDLSLVSELLKHPPREPKYRAARDHGAFVTNLTFDRDEIKRAVIAAWRAEPEGDDYPATRVEELCRSRYNNADWNLAR